MKRKFELELLGNLLGELYLEFRQESWEGKIIHDCINIVFHKRLNAEKKEKHEVG